MRKVLCEMVINTVNIRFSSLLTSLTLGKNHPKGWTEEEDKTVADLILEYKTWTPCVRAKDVWSTSLPNRKIKTIKDVWSTSLPNSKTKTIKNRFNLLKVRATTCCESQVG